MTEYNFCVKIMVKVIARSSGTATGGDCVEPLNGHTFISVRNKSAAADISTHAGPSGNLRDFFTFSTDKFLLSGHTFTINHAPPARQQEFDGRNGKKSSRFPLGIDIVSGCGGD